MPLLTGEYFYKMIHDKGIVEYIKRNPIYAFIPHNYVYKPNDIKDYLVVIKCMTIS